LVVDDDAHIVKSLVRLLSSHGHAARGFCNGRDALVEAGIFLPEVVILDIEMPDMSGLDVCRHLRSRQWADVLHIFALTGAAQNATELGKYGFDAVFSKPLDGEVLCHALAVASAHADSRRARHSAQAQCIDQARKGHILPVQPRPCPLDELDFGIFRPHQINDVLQIALNAALANTGASKGNIQIAIVDDLWLIAQAGFERPFLDYFRVVTQGVPASCGLSKLSGTRTVVSDVANDPIFRGTSAADIMEQAGARACQSTPLHNARGEVIGMLNTHYDKPCTPSVGELRVIDTVAEHTSRWLSAA
jgi:CheY-like chemotaxis protein